MPPRPSTTMGIQPAQLPDPTNWSGVVVTTTQDPQKLMNANSARKGWRVFNLNGATGKLGYNNTPGQAYIPIPVDDSYPVSNDTPCEANEIWFHGAVGATLGVGEA